MSRKDSNFQKISMSLIYRGKEIFKPLNTGRIDEHVACIREWVANIFFYTKYGTTIMIDAGYNYARLAEKMTWLDIDPKTIKHILITHQDTDHVGALETDSELLFKDAAIYLSEIENRYLTGEVRRKVMFGMYSLPMVKTDNKKVLLQDGQVLIVIGRDRQGAGPEQINDPLDLFCYLTCMDYCIWLFDPRGYLNADLHLPTSVCC